MKDRFIDFLKSHEQATLFEHRFFDYVEPLNEPTTSREAGGGL
jgi:hypothetical protein